MKGIKATILAILVMTGMHGISQNAEAYARLDSAAIMIGDQINMELGIKVPDNFVVDWPHYSDTITSHIEIIKRQKIDTLKQDGNLILSKLFTITSFDSGYFEIPPVHFIFHPKGDTATRYTANTNTLFLMVNTPAVDTSKTFKPIIGPAKEPVTLAEILPWVALGLAVAVIVAFLIWYILKRKKNQPLFAHKPKRVLPPHILAINNLEELRLAKIWQQGKVKEYYTRLTDVMREYFEGRFGFYAMEMTSDEIVDSLKDKNINDEVMNKLKDVLLVSDLVKFAKAQPTPLENDLSLNHCIDFVNETKPSTVTPDNEHPEKENELITEKSS